MSNPGMPAQDDDGSADGAPQSSGGDQSQTDDSQDGPTVLFTVLDSHDGGYVLQQGDENSGEDAGDGAADGAIAPGGEGADAASQGTPFSSKGALLKGILDLLNQTENASGNGAQGNFQAGFDGGSAASPAKPAMAQKY